MVLQISQRRVTRKEDSIIMNETHPKISRLVVTPGMCSSLKSLPKPPNVPSASRTLRRISADDIYPIGVKWSPFLTSGLNRNNSSPPPFYQKEAPRPYRIEVATLLSPRQGRFY